MTHEIRSQKGSELWLDLLDLPDAEDPSVKQFFSAVIPAAFWESEISALVPPLFRTLMQHKTPQNKADSLEMFFCFAWSFALSRL